MPWSTVAALGLALAAGAVIWRLQPESRWARAAVIGAVALLIVRYWLWRAVETMPPLEPAFASLWAWGYLALETALFGFALLNLFILLRRRDRAAEADANQAWRASRPAPLVDILIPTYNEARPVIERTVLGALSVTGARTRVWVLDDGCRPWLESLCRQRRVRYLARAANVDAKAGNLNNGLRHIAAHETPPEFVAVFDADFVPQRNFLVRTLALMRGPRVGPVQTLQHFFTDGPLQYNFRAGGIWPEEQRIQYDVLLPARDAWGTTFCCGTSWLARYEALR